MKYVCKTFWRQSIFPCGWSIYIISQRSKQASEQIQVFNIEFNIFSQSNSTYLIYRIQEDK